MDWLIMAACMIAGTMLGVIVGYITWHGHRIGVLRVDHSDPEETYLFLEAVEAPDQIAKHKRVTLKVKEVDFIPRE